jgi:hypothetical protein
VIDDVVQGPLEARKLGIGTVGSENAGVDGRQRWIPHSVTPREMPELIAGVARGPFAVGHGDDTSFELARESNLDGRCLREHAKGEGAIRAVASGQDESDLSDEPTAGEGRPRAGPELEHLGTVSEKRQFAFARCRVARLKQSALSLARDPDPCALLLRVR